MSETPAASTTEMPAPATASVAFKKKKRPQQARRKRESESDDETAEVLDDLRDIQRLRHRPAGISAADLVVSAKEREKRLKNKEDPLKLDKGGMVDLKTLVAGENANADVESSIKQQFSRETSLRDEDAEMRRFVEEEVRRRKRAAAGLNPDDPQPSEKRTKALKPEDELLQMAASKIGYLESAKPDESLGNSMLQGIPEVDLGFNATIRNIEETEAAKVRLMSDAKEKKKRLEEVTRFQQDVWEHTAKDYVQHHIFDIDPTTDLGRAERPAEGDKQWRWAPDRNMIGHAKK